MIDIAVTGGTGSGKTTLAGIIKEYGFTVIDADAMSRELTSPGGRAIPYIRENFGPEFIDDEGGLKRAAMRDLIFRNPEKKKLLERGTTDVVIADIEEIKKDRAKKGDRAVYFDIPLLFETGTEDDYDLVWVISADRDVRADRIMKRDSMDRTIADLMIGSQTEEEVKIAKADYVILNNGTLEELKTAVRVALLNYGLTG